MTEQSSLSLAVWLAQFLDRKGGQDVLVIDTKERSSVADYIVLATGTSSRHMETLLEAPCQSLKQSGYPARSIEGQQTHWMLADLGDVILHVFDSDARENFDLEGLWRNAPRVEWHHRPRLQSQP